MECDKCGEPAVLHAEYSGLHLCEDHFIRSVEKRVKRRIREDALVSSDASPDAPETWVIGLSGGKDSVVLTQLLYETFAHDPRIELLALTIHEGIEGYRDASVDACLELTENMDIRHEVVAYEEEFDLRMDEVADTDPENMAPCAYCGVFRRDILTRYAKEYDADKLLTGHNLDDEAQTALMNILEGDVTQIAKHFDASLGPFEETSGDDRQTRTESETFVPRAKPLRDIPEKEIALFAHLTDLPVHMAECPHASEAYRGEIQQLLLKLEENHPGTRHSIMAGYEDLAGIAAEQSRQDSLPDITECERCGAATTNRLCRKCQLVESIHAA
ncbi:tRNA 2-thiolation protein NcsA [Halocatena pleomorpha]|uniref:TIGR00269 family protein n=1 Tax=Halocatena pleomorpha TaxID=1785090 RepID=A0A3P3RA50_9EURY|nr:TIGR00269 family protein [Halocatena pleomorpha]RRJ30225.1 TIGR00269 family protein [Halocatena pleomorpha]